MIMDNASYCHSKEVDVYREQLGKIKFLFLPTYSPNWNLIERVWKFFKKNVTYNKYYEKFPDFRDACKNFFNNFKFFKAALRKLLNEKFHIPKNA
ncbi:MAG: transposase [Planctomycetaceae bacterium]|jgi:transposase|nr:transposase [Planctomycetaceae bacterium]